jgi:hypothetical protein
LRLVDLGQEELDIAFRDEDVQLVIHRNPLQPPAWSR